MIVATWNVNSLKVRLPLVLEFLQARRPDILALQETKTTDDRFPEKEIGDAGYTCFFYGQKTYNGVALLFLTAPENIRRGIPGFEDEQARALWATTADGLLVASLYAPNGQEVGSSAYAYKLKWFDALGDCLEKEFKTPEKIILMGDFNVAPDDRDVYDPKGWEGQVLVSTEERRAFSGLLERGLCDALRLVTQEGGIYTWWDYRQAAFFRGWGLRLDHVLVSCPLAQKVKGAEVDKTWRKRKTPSDHAPVLATLEI